MNGVHPTQMYLKKGGGEIVYKIDCGVLWAELAEGSRRAVFVLERERKRKGGWSWVRRHLSFGSVNGLNQDVWLGGYMK